MKWNPGGWWERHFLLNEGLLSGAVACGSIVWMERFGGWQPVNSLLLGNRGAIYGALASIFGSLLGFIITAVSIALGFSASEKLTIVRDSRYYPHLWGVFMSATRWLALATVASVVALVARPGFRANPFSHLRRLGVRLPVRGADCPLHLGAGEYRADCDEASRQRR